MSSENGSPAAAPAAPGHQRLRQRTPPHGSNRSSPSPSASPATPATACSSPAPSSPTPPPSLGNDITTFPDFPAEIRAPAGTLAGVSGFQVHFASTDIHTPGDALDTLVAMNPAALKTNLKDLQPGGILIVNTDAFGATDLAQGRLQGQPARRRLA